MGVCVCTCFPVIVLLSLFISHRFLWSFSLVLVFRSEKVPHLQRPLCSRFVKSHEKQGKHSNWQKENPQFELHALSSSVFHFFCGSSTEVILEINQRFQFPCHSGNVYAHMHGWLTHTHIHTLTCNYTYHSLWAQTCTSTLCKCETLRC